MMTDTKLPSARTHDVTPHRPWRRLDTAIVLGLLATGIVIAVALGNDYGLSWDEPLIATYVERLHRAYGSLESKDSVFVDLHFYGPAYFLIAEGISRALREVFSGWSLADGRHAAYFLSYLLGTLSVFVIARGVTGSWAALVAALLMATQPLLFGHAFMNPKDIPFLGFFAAVVAAGILAIQAITPGAAPGGRSARSASQGATGWTARVRSSWARIPRPWKVVLGVAGAVGGVLLVDMLFLGRITLPWLLSMTRAAVTGEAPAPIQAIFDRVTSTGSGISLEAYLHKAAGLYRRAGIFTAGVIAALSLVVLCITVFSKNKDLGKGFAWWWVVSAVLLGVTGAVRVLGPMAGVLVCVLLIYRLRWRSIPFVVLFWLLAAAVTYGLWPYLWGRPVEGLLAALSRAAQSPWDAKVLYFGELVRVIDLPNHFPLIILSLQLTLPALVLGVVGAVLGLVEGRRNGALAWALVLWAWWLVPFVPSLGMGSIVYDNARQLLFALPPFFALSSTAIAALFRLARFRWAQVAISVLILLPGVLAIRQLHPYEYIYYNELTGGVRGAHRRFEMDYWVTGFREAMEHVNEIAPQGAAVGVSGSRAAAAYFAREDLNVWPQGDIGEPGRIPDFLIATTRWDSDARAWPDARVTWRLERDGAVLVVVKDLREVE